MQSGAFVNRMFMRTNHYAIKMHEIAFVKCFNSVFFDRFLFHFVNESAAEKKEWKSVICF